MTAPPRRDSRRDYRHFPPEYSALLVQFDREGRATVGPMSERDARAAIRDLYRFKMYLTDGVDQDPTDEHCRRLLTIASRAIMRIQPVATVSGADGRHATHTVVLALNPIVASVRQQQESKS